MSAEQASLEPTDHKVLFGQKAANRRRLFERLTLTAILLCAAGLRLWRIERNGYGNLYYAAAVRSMLEDPVNFFFGSFDPAGFVTVDKPPVALWIQTVSAALFGFSGPSLLVPQAVMGVGSVLLIYLLVRRVSGPGAALLAALILAITPISVAVDRDNLPDTALVFVLVVAAWALSRAIETGRLWPLLGAAALVGIGFNIKMLAAFVVLPAFYLVYLVGGPGRWWTRLGRLALATGVLAAVSLSWATAVELTPKDRRPYIGGSKTNSAFELALGYNGLGRVFGGSGNRRRGDDRLDRQGPPPGVTDLESAGLTSSGSDGVSRPESSKGVEAAATPFEDSGRAIRSANSGVEVPPGGPDAPGQPPGGPRPGLPWGGRGGFGGTPGLGRFAAPQMAGQITWLFPLALMGGLAAATRARWRPPDLALTSLLLWAGWFLTHWAVFSWAQGIFHEYYTTVLGPALAVLAGIGLVAFWREWFDGSGWRCLLFPLAVLATTGWQAFVISRYPEVRRWLLPIVVGGASLGLLGLIVPLAAKWLMGLRRTDRSSQAEIFADAAIEEGSGIRENSIPGRRLFAEFWRIPLRGVTAKAAAVLGLAALLVAPGYWSLTPLLRTGMAVMPSAGPALFPGRPGREPFGPPPFEGDLRGNAKLVEFLRANRHGERFLVAAQQSMAVSPIIIATGEPAISLGGFMGADPVLTKEDFIRLVEEGQLRFVLGGPPGRGPGGRGSWFGGPDGPPRPGSRSPGAGVWPPDQTPPTGDGQPPAKDALPTRDRPNETRNDQTAQKAAGPGSPTGPPFGPWGGGPPPGGMPEARGNMEIMQWVREHGKEIDRRLWQPNEPAESADPDASPTPARGRRGFGPGRRFERLYDCRPELGLVTP
jgi:4-amino-4-deoxy-L-arabinose transferase-like glycosyltransferase